MLSSLDFYHKYGHPGKLTNLIMWDVPTELEIGIIPKKIYCNKDLIGPLAQAFKNLIERNLVHELKTWDGCWNFRPIRGYEAKYKSLMDAGKIEEAMKYVSIHSWACAVDMNASENQLGHTPKFTHEFVQCFKDAGFEWGGDWKRLDGMHFQLAKLPE